MHPKNLGFMLAPAAAIGLVALTTSTWANQPVFLNSWGVVGTDDGQFNGPFAIALASNGQVYVTDDGNNRVQRFDSMGNFQTKWGSPGTGSGQFNRPLGVGVTETGQVYVLDAANGRVQRFDADGNYQIEWGGGMLWAANGMAVSSGGLVYVADTINDRVQRFDADGTYQIEWATQHPLGLAVNDAGQVYVSDPVNFRIRRFDSDGNFETQWGSAGSGNGQFDNVFGVAVSSNGLVYVTDPSLNRIQRFDHDGNYQAQWGSAGSGESQFAGSLGVAVSGTGLVYVVDLNNNRIQRFLDYESWVDPASHAVPGSITFDSPFSLNTGKELIVAGNTLVSSGVQLTVNGGDLTTHSLSVTPGATLAHTDGTIAIDGGALLPATATYTIDGAAVGNLPTLKLLNGASVSLSGQLHVGQSHSGALEIRSGADVSNTRGYVGTLSGSRGIATVAGTGSTWTNSELFFVGGFENPANGELRIEDGGLVSTSWNNHLGYQSGATGTATVTGTGSRWTGQELYVGVYGTGQLSIENGGAVSNSRAYIGWRSLSDNVVTVTGNGSTWTNLENLFIGGYEIPGNGELRIEDGGMVSTVGYTYLGNRSSATGAATVTGTGSKWTGQQLYVGVYGTGQLSIENGGEVSTAYTNSLGHETGATGTAEVSGTGSRWTGQELWVGYNGTGQLSIENGGAVSNTRAYIGHRSLSDNVVTVTGTGSTWTNSEHLFIGGGENPAKGRLRVENGGVVSTALNNHLGYQSGATGTATVTGTGSKWTGQELYVGVYGTGQLSIENGGTVSSTSGYIGYTGGYPDSATVTGQGSRWSSGFLYVGGNSGGAGGPGTLTIAEGGTVAVANLLTIWSPGTVDLAGGTLEIPEASNIQIQGGKFNYRGTLHDVNGTELYPGGALSTLLGGSYKLGFSQGFKVTGVTRLYDVLTLEGGEFSSDTLVNPSLLQFNSGSFNLTGDDLSVGNGGLFGATLTLPGTKTVRVANHAAIDASGELHLAGGRFSAGTLTNTGLIRGFGRVDGPLVNTVSGQVRGETGGALLLASAGSTNAGVISLGGGGIEFSQDLTNEAGGLINGRGELRVGSSLHNDGALAFSAGITDVYGDVINNPSGRIVVSGGSTTTFYDDVQTNGVFYVANASAAVLFGDFTGAGGTSGGGTIYIEGDLRPGNSPATMSMDNDVVLGPGARLEIELGGIVPDNEFDRLLIGGELSLGGKLVVSLIDLGTGVFQPQLGNVFEIASTLGGINGSFATQQLPDLGPLLDMRVLEEADSVLLTIVPALAGDYNANGTVDAADYVVWRNSLGQTGPGLAADGNDNGSIDNGDLGVWRSHFGQTAGSGLGARSNVAVPEPVTLAMLIFATAACCLRKCRGA